MKATRQLRRSFIVRAAMLAACAASPCASAGQNAPPAAAAVDPAVYTLKIFPMSPGADTAPTALNNRGRVVGSRFLPDPRFSRTAIWDGSKATDWSTFGDAGSVPLAINNAGKIAGRALQFPEQRASGRAVVWRGTTMTFLRTLGGDYGEATAINEAGQVAGYTDTGREYHATLWNGDKVIDLGTLGGTFSIAQGINEAGDVVGYSSTPAEAVYATLWKQGMVYNLGTLGGSRSQAQAVNNKGQVVGWSFVAGSTASRAVLWANGTISDLGTLGGKQSVARAINYGGNIVGYSENAENKGRGTLWQGSRIFDLNTLLDGDATGITITNAFAINESGEILASGITPNGSAFMLLTPKDRRSKQQ